MKRIFEKMQGFTQTLLSDTYLIYTFSAVLIAIGFGMSKCRQEAPKSPIGAAQAVKITNKQNSEIETLYGRIEGLENKVDSLMNIVEKIDSIRYENYRNFPATSIRQSYGDITARYAKQGGKR